MASSYLACRYIRRGTRNSGRVRDRLTRIWLGYGDLGRDGIREERTRII